MANEVTDAPNVTTVIESKPPRIRTVATHLATFALGAACLGGLAYSGVIGASNQAPHPTASPTTQTVIRTLNGLDANTSKIQATEALTTILREIAKNPDANAIGAEVAEGNYDRVPESLKNAVVGGDESIRQATMVAVIYLAAGLGNSVGGADNIKPISEQAIISTADALTEYGTVHIPQSVYTKTRFPMSVTMVYDTESKSWKIDGHDLTIMELNLALAQQNVNAAATPTASASAQ